MIRGVRAVCGPDCERQRRTKDGKTNDGLAKAGNTNDGAGQSSDRSTGRTRWIGTPLARAEDRRLLLGEGRFVANHRAPPLDRALAVAWVRSPYALARIRSIDTSAAETAPGVALLATADDLDLPTATLSPRLDPRFAQPLLADGMVRFAGEAVAVVVAETQALAIDAAEQVDVDYEPLTPDLDLLGPFPPERVVDEVATHHDPNLFADCPIVIERTLINPRQSPSPIEARSMVCYWRRAETTDAELHVWVASQRPHGFRDQLALFYRLAPQQIHVTSGPDVGGGFGGKPSRSTEEHLLPWLARRTGSPVRWIDGRSDYMLTGHHGRGETITMTMGGTAEGRILALRSRLVHDCGAYPTIGSFLPRAYSLPNAAGPYAIERVEFESQAVTTNLAPTSAFRGAGRAPYIAALERMVDTFSRATGNDPADVRRRNLVPPTDMPYRSPTGGVYDAADYPADLERALAAIDYGRWRENQRQRRQEVAAPTHRPRPAIGIGVATYNHLTVTPGGEEAIVTITEEGKAVVVTGTADQGHGHHTTWRQIVAHGLGLHPSDITVAEGSTDLTATGVGAIGSRSLQTAGIAIHRACDGIVSQSGPLAAKLLEAAEADVVFDRELGLFHVVGTPAVAVSWAAIGAAAAEVDQELRCGEHHDPQSGSYPSGCHVAVVEVDLETGKPELLAYVAVDDAGTRVNPMIVDGQLHGGIASGISQALGEVVEYDSDGNLLTGNLASYGLIGAPELIQFDLIPGGVASSHNEHGYKGVGESGTIGATPAVHNAIVDALAPSGVDHIDLPCTPLRIWEALRRAIAERDPF